MKRSPRPIVKRAACWNGIQYRSVIEVGVVQQLTAYGVAYTYESLQFTWSDADTDEIGTQAFTYQPDFVLHDGKTIIECKGLFSPDHQTKYDSFVRCFPEYRFYMLFSKDNWIDGARTQRCSQWCRERDIPFAIGSPVPEAWLR